MFKIKLDYLFIASTLQKSIAILSMHRLLHETHVFLVYFYTKVIACKILLLGGICRLIISRPCMKVSHQLLFCSSPLGSMNTIKLMTTMLSDISISTPALRYFSRHASSLGIRLVSIAPHASQRDELFLVVACEAK